MKIQTQYKALASAFFLLAFLALPSDSCRVTKPLDEEMKKSAQVVLIGSPVAFEIVKCPPQGKGIEPFSFARIKINTAASVRGENKKEWQVNFLNGNFGLPANLAEFKERYGGKLEFGLVMPGNEKYNLTEAYKNFPEIYKCFGKLPCIVQGPCSEPYIVRLEDPHGNAKGNL